MAKKLIFLVVIMVVLYAVFHHSEPTASSTPVADAPVSTPETFAGYDCTDDCTGDCSGHQAGYDWAEEKGITDEDDCEAAGDRSNSPSFAEGCKAFVNGDDPSEQDDKDDDDKEDDNQSSLFTPSKVIPA